MHNVFPLGGGGGSYMTFSNAYASLFADSLYLFQMLPVHRQLRHHSGPIRMVQCLRFDTVLGKVIEVGSTYVSVSNA